MTIGIMSAMREEIESLLEEMTAVEVVEGLAISVGADPAHPVADGWLCAKVRPYLDHVYNPRRLTQPLRRVGR